MTYHHTGSGSNPVQFKWNMEFAMTQKKYGEPQLGQSVQWTKLKPGVTA
jgi:hypothetical protein